MKIHQLLGDVSIAITNEEHKFIKVHKDTVSLESLNEHEIWVAQNLVRKNIYKVKNKNLILNHEHVSNI